MVFRKIIVQSGLILLAGFLAIFSLRKYQIMPDLIPGTPISLSGFLGCSLLIVTFIVFEKKMLRLEPESSIWELISAVVLGSVFAECIFQLIRQFTFSGDSDYDHLIGFWRSIVIIGVEAALFAFLVAFQLRFRKVGWLILFIILTIVLCNLILHLLPK